MKRFVVPALAAALLLSAGAAQAQLSAGHILVGGDAGYTSNHPDDQDATLDTKTTTGSFSPRIGYFIKDNLAIGLDIQYHGTKEVKDENDTSVDGTVLKTTTTNTSALIGPFVRYYKPVGEKAAFFGHLNLGFGGEKQKTELSGRDKPTDAALLPKDVKYGNVNVALRPGFAYFPTKHFGFELTTNAIALGYNNRKLKDLASGQKAEDFTSNGFYAQADLRSLISPTSWQIGATFYLGGGE